MTGLEGNVADAIARWAAEQLEVRRVWLFGSRAKGSHRPDIDVGIELETVADSEETSSGTQWIAHCDSWEGAQLQRLTLQKSDLEWFARRWHHAQHRSGPERGQGAHLMNV